MNRQLPTHSRYSSVAIGLHWSIAALIIVNLTLGIGHEAFGKASVMTVMDVHKSIGFTVLLLSLIRLGWRLGHPVPPLPATVPGWQVIAARTTHYFMYLAMICMPLSGWLMSSAFEKRMPLSFFWLFEIPFLPVRQGKETMGLWHETHEILGFSLIAVLILHVLAALKHHLVDKDDVFVRMLPKR